jgi:predicted ferric reductase
MTATTQSRRRPLTATTSPASSARDRAWTIEAVVVANAIVTIALWLGHGGAGTLDQPGGVFTAVGQLTGLAGTYAILVQLLLMSRIGWLERYIGFDRLAVWHRWNGFASVSLLVAHAVFITLGYAATSNQSIPTQLGDFVQHYPDVLMSIVGLGLFIAIAATSVRAARRRLSREAWYSIHVYAYLAVALSFAHQLAVGNDFVTDPLARAWWVALYVAVFGAIVAWRVARPIWFNARHRLQIHHVRREADGIVSLYISGRHLDDVRAEAGQFFLWRFGTGTGWATAHPFSLSAPPNRKFLRITVKDLGDHSRRLQHLQPGTRVFAEGPYGTFTAQRRTRARVALIAGGIGITPLRALVETLPAAPGDVTLLYRAAVNGDVAFAKELRELADKRGIDLRHLIGVDIGNDQTDQLGVPAIRYMIPDIAERDVFVCGPPAMLTAVRRRLRALRVPLAQIHFERFEY